MVLLDRDLIIGQVVHWPLRGENNSCWNFCNHNFFSFFYSGLLTNNLLYFYYCVPIKEKKYFNAYQTYHIKMTLHTTYQTYFECFLSPRLTESSQDWHYFHSVKKTCQTKCQCQCWGNVWFFFSINQRERRKVGEKYDYRNTFWYFFDFECLLELIFPLSAQHENMFN